MATKTQHIDLEIAHFDHFTDKIPDIDQMCQKTVQTLLKLGILQVSTAFEHALAKIGDHEVVGLDKGDLLKNKQYSDAKLSCVRTSGYGKVYSAPVTNIYNKTGTLRVQVYERKQNKFYYFAFPRRAYIDVPKTSNIEIPFELDGTPRRKPKRPVYVNWWNYEVDSWEKMATKYS